MKAQRANSRDHGKITSPVDPAAPLRLAPGEFRSGFLGQMTNGKKYWSDGQVVAGQQFEYGFDDIGNRKAAASGGNEWGTNLRYENYTANNLNQYTGHTVPGYVDVLGAANSNAVVTVQTSTGVTSAYRKGEYFRAEVHPDNTAGTVWLGLTNLAILRGATTNVADITATNSGFVLVPPRQQTFAHDADGNLTNDSVWSYVWEGENRLVGMDGLTTLPAGARQSLRFTFDSQGRRTSKVVSNWTGSAWSKTSEQRFVYDGWNLLAIFDSQSSIFQSFLWGLDLSGTPQGAGGVGGLLAVNDAAMGAHFTCYDGNGNITALVKASDGTESARYEYSPFGQVLRATGPMAETNVFRFSTKYQDDESDFLYYGYRSYNASTGRWLNRDPIEAAGGLNLYGFVENAPVGFFDSLGEQTKPGKPGGPMPPQPPKPNPYRLILSSVNPPKATSDCGGAESTVKYRLEGAAGKTGWLLQHVKGDYKVKDCKGKPIPGKYGTFEYWEAWHVIDGVVYVDPLSGGAVSVKVEGGEDLFGIPDQGKNTKGTLRKEGYAEFYEDYKLAKPPWGSLPAAGGLPALETPPFTWSDSGKLFHNLSTEYDCCCSPNKKTTVKGFPYW